MEKSGPHTTHSFEHIFLAAIFHLVWLKLNLLPSLSGSALFWLGCHPDHHRDRGKTKSTPSLLDQEDIGLGQEDIGWTKKILVWTKKILI